MVPVSLRLSSLFQLGSLSFSLHLFCPYLLSVLRPFEDVPLRFYEHHFLRVFVLVTETPLLVVQLVGTLPPSQKAVGVDTMLGS